MGASDSNSVVAFWGLLTNRNIKTRRVSEGPQVYLAYASGFHC